MCASCSTLDFESETTWKFGTFDLPFGWKSKVPELEYSKNMHKCFRNTWKPVLEDLAKKENNERGYMQKGLTYLFVFPWPAKYLS